MLIRTDVDQPPGPDPVVITGTHPQGEVAVLLDNQSQQPVLDMQLVGVVLQMRTGTEAGQVTAPPQDWAVDPSWNPGEAPVAAGDGRRWRVIVRRPDGSEQYERHTVMPNDEYVATVRFIDAAGLVWERTGREQPRRVLQVTRSLAVPYSVEGLGSP